MKNGKIETNEKRGKMSENTRTTNKRNGTIKTSPNPRSQKKNQWDFDVFNWYGFCKIDVA